MGGAHRPDAGPVPNTPILHNGTGKNTDVMGQRPAHANFGHLYGTFPTSMGMDVAAAMLLLRTEHLLRLSFPQFDGGPAFHENPRIGCLKQGETVLLLRAGRLPGVAWPPAGRRDRVCCLKESESGDWGAVVLARA